MKFATALLASVSLAVASLPAIEVNGNAFWNSKTGDRFYIRGVDYQPRNNGTLVDPLADESICLRDVEYFKELGLNTVRVYTVDNSLDHSTCMEALDQAGIYLILDVNTPEASISRYAPACSYNARYLQSILSTVDVFAKYDNVLGFFAGNEVINDMENTTAAAPYVKAVVRDMKQYMRAQNYRAIPVGYSAADVTSNVYQTAAYFNCGNDEDARIDMLGVNDYSWCGASSFVTSGYKNKVTKYTGYSLPIFFSEYGCNTVGDSRAFSEVGTIYSKQMTGVFSGGLVYEYSEEDNNYGLVELDENGNATTLPDFDNLRNELNATSDPTGDGGYAASNSISSCPTFEAGVWEVANETLPELPSAASIFFKSGAGEPLGTDIGDTQWGCYDNNEANVSSSSAPASSSSSTAQTSSSSSSPTASASSSASSSSKALANSVVIPAFYNIVYSMGTNAFGSAIAMLLIVSGVAVLA
jgi:hypothetical protein